MNELDFHSHILPLELICCTKALIVLWVLECDQFYKHYNLD